MDGSKNVVPFNILTVEWSPKLTLRGNLIERFLSFWCIFLGIPTIWVLFADKLLRDYEIRIFSFHWGCAILGFWDFDPSEIP